LTETAATLLHLTEQEDPPLLHLATTSQNEIGTLILSFNRMLDCLDKRQQSLRNSEQKLFTILENVEAYIYLKDFSGRYLFANRLVRELFGVNGIEEVVGQTDERFFDAATVRQLDINDRQVLDEGTTLRTEETNRNLRTGGSSTYLSVKIPLRDENGAIYALCGISTDITDRKRHEEQLSAALAQAHRFQQALDNISAYIYMKDKQHRYVFANKTTQELFDCNLEQLIGSEDARFFPPETTKMLHDIDAQVLEHGENSAQEIIVRGLDGSRKTYWEVKTPIYDEHHPDQIWGLCGISTDITERKKLEEELALKEQTLRAILETTDECVKLVAYDGTLISMNRAGLKLVEATSEEQVIGRSVYGLIASEDREAYRSFNEHICQGASGNMQYEIIGLQGTRLRIPVNVATQTAGKLPPKPVKAATLDGVVGA
jgi:PAS domain S-box-containing protein